MTKTALNTFRRALGDRQSEIGNRNRNREALAIETSSDVLDRIHHSSDRDFAMSNLERDSNRLREVQTALRRIDLGTFGVCVGCDEDINPRRLAAVPWTLFCIVCQEAVDRAQKMPGNEIYTSLVTAA